MKYSIVLIEFKYYFFYILFYKIYKLTNLALKVFFVGLTNNRFVFLKFFLMFMAYGYVK